MAYSQQSIEAITAIGSRLVAPVITPRFTPACTDPGLTGLGELAEATGVHVQTHCSESDWHHGYSIDGFGCSDTEALERFGLLRPHTVLAHSDRMSDGDARCAVGREVGVATVHCQTPISPTQYSQRDVSWKPGFEWGSELILRAAPDQDCCLNAVTR